MAEMNTMFAQMRLKVKEKEAKAEEKEGAKGGDDGDDGGAKAEAKGEAKATARGKAGGPGLTLFSQPIGLEYLLDSVLNLAEYETLRMMMIMKARERRI